ncbi:MAG: Pyruvate-ferrodoxin oxidoreductase [Streblomastix strix]|uniref:Pyruvate-ferrodoxin oxidoreductase n=1 Tax=Streblomastix strix TaxID=222440 RepID=A0A5J4WW19_9EUKA|nr:MAG: Pyruvate-ferrodoxin oxidoreductase [Streblomastix strix]
MIIANAIGYSSVWGGSAPWCPNVVNSKGHGSVWANSLFEVNTEYGIVMLISTIQKCKRTIDVQNKVGSSSDTQQAVKEVEQYCIANVKPTEKPHSTNDELKKSIVEITIDDMRRLLNI